jgi:hypothetical protein
MVMRSKKNKKKLWSLVKKNIQLKNDPKDE